MTKKKMIWWLLLLLFADIPTSSARASGWSGFTEFRFLAEPSDVLVVRNQPAILHCEAEAGDFGHPTIRWKRDGQFLQFPDFNDKSLSNQRRQEWVTDDSKRRLLSNGSMLISRSNQLDEGMYQCVASVSGLGTMVSKTAKFLVADIPLLDTEPPEVDVIPGQTAVFQCRVDQPRIERNFFQIKWLKDDQPLLTDHRMNIFNGLLEIGDVKVADRGEYRCNVTTPEGSESQLSKPASLKLNFDGGLLHSPPVFLARPKNTKAYGLGSEVTMECAASGNPKPEIMWLKDGASLDLNHLDSRFHRVGSGSLHIKDLRPEDAGTYQCRAENSEDSIDAAAELQVARPPTFTKRPQNTVALEKGDIKLECEVAGEPQPTVQWYKNGDLIIESEYFQIVGGSSLKILGLVGLDSGIYQCVAANVVGNIQSSAELKVTKKLIEAEVMSMKSANILPADQAILPRSDDPSPFVTRDTPSAPMDLKAAIVASRFVTLSWSPPMISKEPINGYSIFYKQEGSNRERVLNSTRGNLEEVNINGLSPGTSYLFRIVARNQHGTGESSDPLKVFTEAEIDLPGPVLRLEAKPTTSFSILVSWSPPAHTSGVISKYNLYYRQGDFSTPTKNVIVESDSLQYHVTELREFTEYVFWISASNGNGEGALSEEITCMTFSDLPADPPQNVSLEAISSTSLTVRWEPPPKESQNGIITGYKIRWRLKGKGQTEIVTTDGSRRLFVITGLSKDKEYQVKMAAMTVNGTGPATSWMTSKTLLADLDESVVPDPPNGLIATSTDADITIHWQPPRINRIMVRGYTIGWGKGIPDEYTQIVDGKHREFVIPDLKPNSEYVISLRAYNNIGDGRPIYETVRTKEKSYDPEPATPLLPPVGLHPIVLSSSTVVLTWMDSTLPRNQVIPDARYYIVQYGPVSEGNLIEAERHFSYRNSTDLNVMIDDLRPATEYEFAVKIVKGRRQSGWSLVATNRTREAAPTSAPKDILIRQAGPNSVHLSWRPPKHTNGHINGYVIQYTTDRRADDRDWFVEAVVGDGTMATIRNLLPDTKYYFKMSARNNKGYGPPGQIVHFTTAPNLISDFNSARTNLIDSSNLAVVTTSNDEISPIVLYAVFGVGAGIILVLVIGAVVLIRYKCQAVPDNEGRNNKTYHNAESMGTGTREKLNPPPPDLWIGHDQLELKDISDEAASAICDETGETTLTRSTPDYRATMERTRNYIQNGQYSGTDSEVSFSLLNGLRGGQNPRSSNGGLCSGARLIVSPTGHKPVKIAAISGKPRVQRYLSRESVASSIINGSSASSSTYIRSQYNINPPPLNMANTSMFSDRLMDLSLTSPDDLPPLPGYDPSLTCTAPSDGPPSTIGDPDAIHSVNGSVLGISASGSIPAQPPQVPATYLSSAMSTSSGDSSSNTTNSHNGNSHFRRQSSGSHASTSHLRSFSTSNSQPKNLNPAAPTSPFKKPSLVGGNLNHHISVFGFSSNGSDSGSSMATTSSSSGGRQTSERPPSVTDSPFQSGHLPTIADVRSPDVLHPQDGPCDCLSHPMRHSLSAEELNAEMKNLEGLMKDLNSISPVVTKTNPSYNTNC